MASKNLKQLDVQNLYLLNMPSKLLLAGLLIVWAMSAYLKIRLKP